MGSMQFTLQDLKQFQVSQSLAVKLMNSIVAY